LQSTLSAQVRDLLGEVGFFLGFGRGPYFGDPEWDTQQRASIERCIKGGQRNFYHCGYEWSFLKPVGTFTLNSGETILGLPDDYGGAEGQITITSTNGISWYPIDFVGVGRVYQRQSESPEMTGRPIICCQEPLRGTGATDGQRYQLNFFPIADQDYTLQFQYYLLPDALSGNRPYAYGGAEHAETLLESCLAVAEKILDDAATVHAMEFEKRLAVSMDLDRRKKPQTLGPNLDRSDMQGRLRHAGWRSWSGITVNGTQY
jgi:hypothetical protein